MERLSRFCTSFCTMICIVGLCSTCSGQTPNRTKRSGQLRGVKPVGELVPLIDNALPYSGEGSITIMDDGTLQVTVGGTIGADLTTNPIMLGGETITYKLDTEELAVIVSNREVFLDKNGQQLRERGLNDQQVSITKFTGNASPLADPLIELTGQLDMSFDATMGELTLTLEDTESSGQIFSLTASVNTTSPRGYRDRMDRSRKAVQMAKTVKDFRRPVKIDLILVLGSSCSTTCTNGSSSINCPKSGCKCICDNGNPTCTCTFTSSSE